jgi:hypothetical protein
MRRRAARAAPEFDHRLYRPGGMTALYDAIAHTVLKRRWLADGEVVWL